MTCKDCLHYEACKGTYFTFEPITNKDSFDSEHYADVYDCSDFTDRSEWVHLPCNIGRTAYFIRDGKIIETVVEKIVIKKNGKYLKLSCNAMYETSCKNIGKTVFFDREEAEKVMERMKENEENTI